MYDIGLLIPNEKRLSHTAARLAKKNYSCLTAMSPQEAIALTESNSFRLFIIDSTVAWTDTQKFLRYLQNMQVPVLFLCSDHKNSSHIKALYHAYCEVIHSGCTAKYLIDTIARMITQLKDTLVCGSLTLKRQHHAIYMNNNKLELTEQEYALLQALMESPNEPVSRDELLRTAWGYKSIGETRTVDVHIQRLRKKLGTQTIETVYKTGYRLTPA